MPLLLQNFLYKKNHIYLLQNVEVCMCITMWSSRTLSFCMPSSIRWRMAPSHVFSLHLLLKFFFSIISNRKFWFLLNGYDWMRLWGIWRRRRRSLRESCWQKVIQVAYYFLPFFHFNLTSSSLYLFTPPLFLFMTFPFRWLQRGKWGRKKAND